MKGINHSPVSINQLLIRYGDLFDTHKFSCYSLHKAEQGNRRVSWDNRCSGRNNDFVYFFLLSLSFSVWLVLKTKSCRCNEVNPSEEVSLIQFKIVIVNSHFTWNWKLSSTLGQVKGPSPHTATISSYGNSLIKSCRPLGLNCRPQRLALVHRFAPSCSQT